MKLRSLAKDAANTAFKSVIHDMSPNDNYAYESYIKGFEEGFKTLTKEFNSLLDEEKARLSDYPMLSERLLAVTTIQTKLNSFYEGIEK